MRCLIVVFIALVAFVAADEEWKPISDPETISKIGRDCYKEAANVFGETILVNKDEHHYIKEREALVLCFGKTYGYFTVDKGYNIDRLIATFDVDYLDAEKARDIITNCADNNEQNSTPAEWALRGENCMLEGRIFDVMTVRKKN